MIPVNTLITKLNDLITAGGLTDLELAQAFGAIDSLENKGVNSAETTASLPPAADNKGIFFYIISENRYVLSNGISWSVNNILRAPPLNGYSWGYNNIGQLGDNTTTNKSSPVRIIGFTDWTLITAGRQHSMGLRSDGTAWAWGNNGYGRLGDNTTVPKSSPVSVLGNFTDWVQLAANTYHNLGVRANGTAWSWGFNGNGQLGDNTTTSRRSPVSVIGGFTDWIQVSAGRVHSTGIRANGSAWAWGNNQQGQLGDNSTVSKISPVSVIGGFTDWIQVSAGRQHNVALRANGTIWSWGDNANAVLGDGTFTQRSSPVSVLGGFTDWVQVSAGYGHNLAIRANGTAWAWGSNASGRLGVGDSSLRSSPTSVVGGFTDWVQVSGGFTHSLGLRANGTIWAWGNGDTGRLGDGTTAAQLSPVSILGGFTDWAQISQGSFALSSFGIKA